MTNLPGGPTDPTLIWQAIQNGAAWSSNHLVVEGVNQWLTIDTANTWQLTTSAATLLDQDTFNALRSGTMSGSFVIVGGSRFQLDPVQINGSTWAVLQPA